jgi:hypothetical protein
VTIQLRGLLGGDIADDLVDRTAEGLDAETDCERA